MGPLREYARTLKIYVLNSRSGEANNLAGIAFFLLVILPILLGGPTMLAQGAQPWTLDAAARAGKAFLIVYLMTYSGLMLNDLCDIEADVRTNSKRPLPQGLIQPRPLFVISVLFIVLSLAVGLSLNVQSLILTAALALQYFVHYGYTKKNLKVPGSPELLTSMQTAFLPVACFFALGRFDAPAAWWLTAFFWMAIFSYDIAGGIKDRDGDVINGVHTFAATLGNKVAAALCLATFVLTLAIGAALWRQTILSGTFVVVLGLMGAVTVRTHLVTVARPDAANGALSFFGGGKFLVATCAAMIVDVVVHRLRGIA